VRAGQADLANGGEVLLALAYAVAEHVPVDPQPVGAKGRSVRVGQLRAIEVQLTDACAVQADPADGGEALPPSMVQKMPRSSFSLSAVSAVPFWLVSSAPAKLRWPPMCAPGRRIPPVAVNA